MEDHIYLVFYDISDQKRWRRVFRTMKGYGEWLQLSVFQCLLSRKQQVEMVDALRDLINHAEDHVVIMDIGPSGTVEPRVTSIGKTFEAVSREPVIV